MYFFFHCFVFNILASDFYRKKIFSHNYYDEPFPIKQDNSINLKFFLIKKKNQIKWELKNHYLGLMALFFFFFNLLDLALLLSLLVF